MIYNGPNIPVRIQIVEFTVCVEPVMVHLLGLGKEIPFPEDTSQMKVNSVVTVSIVVVGGVVVGIAFGERGPEKRGCAQGRDRTGSSHSLPAAACWRMEVNEKPKQLPLLLVRPPQGVYLSKTNWIMALLCLKTFYDRSALVS